MKNRKGLSFIEILVSVVILAIMALAVANFSAQFFKAANIHALQIEKINFSRFTSERISDEIRKAEYIYPSGVSLNLGGAGITLDTTAGIGLLIPADKDNLSYRFTAFYLQNGNLMEFHSDLNTVWDENVIPAEELTEFSGKSQSIASNIDSGNSQLMYNLNYYSGTSDSLLKGEISSIPENSTKALIKGIKWHITIKKASTEKIIIDGVSNNVPRFIE